MREDGLLRKSWRRFVFFLDALNLFEILFLIGLVLAASGLALYDCVARPFKAEEPRTEKAIPSIGPR